MPSKRHATAALVTAAMIGLSGCGSSGGDSQDAANAAPKSPSMTHSSNSGGSGSSPSPSMSSAMSGMSMITIKDFAYSGANTVRAGEMVHVTNEDTSTHTLTSDQSGQFDVTVDAGGNATFNAPSKPGKYPYHCTFHSDMHGMLVVK